MISRDDEVNDYGNENDGELEDKDAVPYKDKISLSQKVKFLSQEQLGLIVKIIQDECPDAFKEVIIVLSIVNYHILLDRKR